MPIGSLASPKHSKPASQSNTPLQELSSDLIPSLDLPNDAIENSIIPFLAPPKLTDTFRPGYDEAKELASLARTNKQFRQFIQAYHQRNDGFYQKLIEALRWSVPLRQQFPKIVPPSLRPSSSRPQLSEVLDHPDSLKSHPPAQLTELCAAIYAMQDGTAKAKAIHSLAQHPQLSPTQWDTLMAATHTLLDVNTTPGGDLPQPKALALHGLAQYTNLSKAQFTTLMEAFNTTQGALGDILQALAKNSNLSTEQLGTLLNASNRPLITKEKADVLLALAPHPNLSTEQFGTLVNAILTLPVQWWEDETIKHNTIQTLAQDPDLSPTKLDTLLDATHTMENKWMKASTIKGLAKNRNLSTTQWGTLVAATHTMEDGRSKRAAIEALQSRMYTLLDQLPTTT